MLKEKKFYETLQQLFIGAELKGKGGFIRLMQIKANYYKKIEKLLQRDIQTALNGNIDFREELFDKLYTFFKRYFSENGSIFFYSTPFHSNFYEKVYTNEKDLVLFWKTSMLYYVKTDKIFQNLEVVEGNLNLQFDVSCLEHKQANEKKQLVYRFKEIREIITEANKTVKQVVLEAKYSERSKTDEDSILKEIKNAKLLVRPEHLEKAFRVFERQNDIDFFINKNAEAFLKEQFKLWSYQYFWNGDNDWQEKRVKQLVILKNIAFKVIDFIAQFENELVKIWNKPKFVKNSNYVITLDKLDEKLKTKILKNLSQKQIAEWQGLGMITEKKEIEKKATLPIDTKYLSEDLKLEILSQFENLDEALDGWLIKSENYQALNTILPKFKEQIQTIYIDPPFNLDKSTQFDYLNNYKDSSWATLLENRLQLAKNLLNNSASIFVRCDYNGNWIVRCLLDSIFGKDNFRNEIVVGRKRQDKGTSNKFEVSKENIYLFSKNVSDYTFNDLYENRKLIDINWTSFLSPEERNPKKRTILGLQFHPPKGQHFSLVQDKCDKLIKENFLRIKHKTTGAIFYYSEDTKNNFFQYISKGNTKNRIKFKDIYLNTEVYGCKKIKDIKEFSNATEKDFKIEYLKNTEYKVSDDWKDIPSYSSTTDFKTENSEQLLERVIQTASQKEDLVCDYFLGSGTTTAVSHKIGRRWLGIEQGEHFETVILPRMKKVLAYDKGGISKKHKEYKGGGFFKYYELEQYEEALANCSYKDAEPIELQPEGPYKQYIFLNDEKLAEKTVSSDEKQNRLKIKLDRLYPNLDLAETISNLKGKPIKKISKTAVVFVDGETIDLQNLKLTDIKPLIWWE